MRRFEHRQPLAMAVESGAWTQGQAKSNSSTSSLPNNARGLFCLVRHYVDYLTSLAYSYAFKNKELNLAFTQDSVWRQKRAA